MHKKTRTKIYKPNQHGFIFNESDVKQKDH